LVDKYHGTYVAADENNKNLPMNMSFFFIDSPPAQSIETMIIMMKIPVHY